MESQRGHAETRAIERMAQAGLNPSTVLTLARQAASAQPVDTAIRLVTLDKRCGDDNDNVLDRASNGDTVWAIARQQHLVTLMLRGSWQPSTPDALKVERVLGLTMSDGKVRCVSLKR